MVIVKGSNVSMKNYVVDPYEVRRLFGGGREVTKIIVWEVASNSLLINRIVMNVFVITIQ